MLSFLKLIFGRIFFYFIALPLLIVSGLAVLMLVAMDIYNYQSTMSLLSKMDPYPVAGTYWTPDQQIALVTGQITAWPLEGEIVDRAPHLKRCVAAEVTASERWKGRRGRTRTREVFQETLVAPNIAIGSHSLDRALLNMSNFDLEEVRYSSGTALGYLCAKADPSHECVVTVTCLTAQPASAMGNIRDTTADALSFPKQLGDKDLPLMQLGIHTPQEFGPRFAAQFGQFNLSTVAFGTVAFLSILLFASLNRAKLFGMLAVVTILAVLPFHMLSFGIPAYIPLILFFFAATYLIAMIIGALRPMAGSTAASTGSANPSMPASIYITPDYMNNPSILPSGSGLTSSHDDMIAPALAHIKTRLSALTVAALSPEQLEKTVRMHIETQAPERWSALSDIQQLDLLAKVITALRQQK